MTSPPFRFHAMWPILDPTVSAAQLAREANESLPTLVRQAHARLLGRGVWTVLPSSACPGSGGVAAYMLVFQAPAAHVARRTLEPYADVAS